MGKVKRAKKNKSCQILLRDWRQQNHRQFMKFVCESRSVDGKHFLNNSRNTFTGLWKREKCKRWFSSSYGQVTILSFYLLISFIWATTAAETAPKEYSINIKLVKKTFSNCPNYHFYWSCFFFYLAFIVLERCENMCGLIASIFYLLWYVEVGRRIHGDGKLPLKMFNQSSSSISAHFRNRMFIFTHHRVPESLPCHMRAQ